MAFSVIFAAGGKTFAAPIDQQLSSSKSQYSQAKSKESTAKNKADALTASIEILENKLQKAMLDIADTDKKISNTEASIVAAEANVKKAEESIKVEQDRYNKSMRTMYMNGSNGYLGALLDSKGINDFISKVEVIHKVADYNNQVISNLNQRKVSVNNKKDILNGEKKQLVALKQTKQNTVAVLNKEKQQEQPLLAQAKTELSSAVALSSAAQAQINAINSRVTAMNAQATINRGGIASSDEIVAYALKFVGVPYVTAGSSPSGFDCSGLVQYVYAHFGKNISRTTYTQINDGPNVTSNPQPGDLVFFGSASAPHHVGMYIGGGQMIEAPRPGESVRVTSYSRSDYCAAVRVR